ncbi:MAG TPA: hypothetical protein VFG03_18475 [Telluria sp.]|nr:hypothetical protein [Telluria sp.]
MMQSWMSTVMWKWMVSMLTLGLAILLAIECSHAVKPMVARQQGSLGVTLADQIGADNKGQGTYRLRIDGFDEVSTLRDAGALVGDRVQFDSHVDRWRKFAPDSTVELTLLPQTGGARHLSLQAKPVKITVAEYGDYWARFALALPALLFALMIGFRQSHGPAYRSLSLTFLALSLSYYFSFNYSSGTSYFISKLATIVTYPLIWYGCVVFALNYQPYDATRPRVWLNRIFPWYRLLSWGTAAYSVGFALGWETPLLWLGTLLGALIGLAMTLISLVDGWRWCTGEIRQRHLWLLLSFFVGALPAMLILVPAFDWELGGMRVIVMVHFVGMLLMYCGLAYAVLKYRVFNFDFAISRVLVFSVVNLLLLSLFGLIEWAMHGGLSGHGPEKKSALVDAGVALITFLVFHKVHDTLERRVERLFFRQWHDNEHKLRDYARQAAHVTTVDALLGTLRSAIDRFTAHAGCALYLRQAGGEFALVPGATLDGAPAHIDANDGAVLAMRPQPEPLFLETMQTTLPAELMMPMCHRNVLNGLVLLGSKWHGESYRPDECKVLQQVIEQVGLDLHVLRVDMLERELQDLERETRRKDEELQLMAGRRRSVRPTATAQASAVA